MVISNVGDPVAARRPDYVAAYEITKAPWRAAQHGHSPQLTTAVEILCQKESRMCDIAVGREQAAVVGRAGYGHYFASGRGHRASCRRHLADHSGAVDEFREEDARAIGGDGIAG